MSQVRTPEESKIARAFGANVRMTVSDRSLYLVVGRKQHPVRIINQTGGRVILKLPNTTRLLALLNLPMAAALRRHPDIVFVGPITIDPERFSHFAAAAGLDLDAGS